MNKNVFLGIMGIAILLASGVFGTYYFMKAGHQRLFVERQTRYGLTKQSDFFRNRAGMMGGRLPGQRWQKEKEFFGRRQNFNRGFIDKNGDGICDHQRKARSFSF